MMENNKLLRPYKILKVIVKTLQNTSIFCWWCCHGFDNEPHVPSYNLVMDMSIK